MNNRERVLASLSHEQPDRTPYHIGLTLRALEAMQQHCGDSSFLDSVDNCFTILNTDLPDGWKEVGPGIWQDEYGVQWDRSVDKDIGTVCNLCVTADNVDDYPFPDPHDPARYDGYEETVAASSDTCVAADIGFSLFERAWTLAGMETVLLSMVADPDFLHRLLDRILEHNLCRIDHACSKGIDIMRFGDDWGQQLGLMMGPELWRTFIKPRVARMYGLVKDHGKYVMIHSCGKVDAIFPDLIEIGVDIFNPFQPEVIDVYETKRVFGDRLSFYGGISTQKTLPYGDVDEVRREVRKLIEIVGKDGGYIASPAHAIPADARPENVLAMIDELNNQ